MYLLPMLLLLLIAYTNQSHISMDFGSYEAQSNTHSAVNIEQCVLGMGHGAELKKTKRTFSVTYLFFMLLTSCSMRFVSVRTLMV